MFQELFYLLHLVLTVGSLLAVFGFLLGRTAAVGSRNILLFLGLGCHLSFVGVFAFATPAEGNAILKNALKIVFAYHRMGFMGLMEMINLLMMEQTNTCEGHGNTIFIAGHDDMVVAN